jgi:hypothetical protein
MSERTCVLRAGRGLLALACLTFVLGLAAWAVAAPTSPQGDQGKKPKGDSQRGFGECASPAGSMIVCDKPGRPCNVLKANSIIYPGDLIVALPGSRGELEFPGVKVSLLSTLEDLGKSAVLDTAIRVNQTDKFDLDITLVRGRVLLAHSKDKGTIRVRVRFQDQSANLELLKPKTDVALELFSRWRPGTPFQPKPGPDYQPETYGAVMLLAGEVNASLNDSTEQTPLRGHAMIEWSSSGGSVGPLPLKKLPEWVAYRAAPKDLQPAVKSLRSRLAKKDLVVGLADALRDGNPEERRLAVYSLGSAGDLGGLLQALGHPKHVETRGAAAETMRYWMHRGVADEGQLYQVLLKNKFNLPQAETVMQLLHGFTLEELARATTYEVLIDYLKHDQLAIRHLAAEQLYTQVPQGKNIVYDPASSAQDIERAQAAWRKLIPPGKLPPRDK